MTRYKCIVSYDGTNYSGFQIQKNSLTIQQVLQEVFEKRFQQRIEITGASRTDSGVHALGQVIHFDIESIQNAEKFIYQINCMLPKDIRILSIEKMPENFHSRYLAEKKTYYYFITTAPHQSPFQYKYQVVLPSNLDIKKMEEGAQYFLGTHDFRAFAHQSDVGCAKNKPIKTIIRFDFIKTEDGYRIEIEGDGFLHKMVRNMIGTLVDVGLNKISPLEIDTILKSCDRKLAGQTAPAHGLFLAKISYRNSSSKET